MEEITVNLHMHTRYSDGTGTHEELAQAAIRAGLDAIIITDHNIWVQGVEKYFTEGEQKVLVLVGEEVHDQARQPQKNHLLVFGTEREMSHYGPDPQNLINQIAQAGGLSFIAHPVDPESAKFNQGDLSWVSWEVQGFNGIELWNAMSEFKSLLTGYIPAIRYSFNFDQVAHGPLPETLTLWDQLLAKGKPVVAVGGSDAHQMVGSLGPIKRSLFPYEQHFRAVNTHLLLTEPLKGNLSSDKQLIYQALAAGHAFIGYDLPASTKGFRFSAHSDKKDHIMGDTIEGSQSVTLQIKLPQAAECLLLKDGQVIKTSRKRVSLIHRVDEPGVYRVEAYIDFNGKRRGWIFSNPIYIR